jgi:DNA recombination protein RmuC
MIEIIQFVLFVGLVVGVAVWLSAMSRRQATALRQEMQALLAAQSQSVSAQLGSLGQAVTAQISQVTQQVQTGVASAGALTSESHKAVAEQLQASTEMLGDVRQKLGEVQQAGHQLSNAARQIENVLGGAKTRGVLGEVALDRMLCDTLPPAAYEMQHRFSTGEAVDAIVRLRDKLLPIDSKFPLDDYRRLIEVGEDARKGFERSVRNHADAIAKKYIVPDENTFDFALMFVPSEGVYYEMLHSIDPKGVLLDEYCRAKKVVPVSPSTLYAILQVILIGLQGMQIEENAKRILGSLSGLQKQMGNFGEVYDKLGGHLKNASQSFTEAGGRLERARNSLDELARGVPTPDKVLEVPAPKPEAERGKPELEPDLEPDLSAPFKQRALRL